MCQIAFLRRAETSGAAAHQVGKILIAPISRAQALCASAEEIGDINDSLGDVGDLQTFVHRGLAHLVPGQPARTVRARPVVLRLLGTDWDVLHGADGVRLAGLAQLGQRGIDAGKVRRLRAVGEAAAIVNSTGNNNTAVGFNALLFNSTSNNNTAVCSNALSNTTGGNNIGLGNGAGSNLGSGSNNIYVGTAGDAAGVGS